MNECRHNYRRDVETCPHCDLIEAEEKLDAALAEVERLRDENFKLQEDFDLLHRLADAAQTDLQAARGENERLSAALSDFHTAAAYDELDREENERLRRELAEAKERAGG